MTDTKKADQTASPKETHVDYTSQESLIKAANAFSKQSRILAHLLAGESLNRFDAERLGSLLADHYQQPDKSLRPAVPA